MNFRGSHTKSPAAALIGVMASLTLSSAARASPGAPTDVKARAHDGLAIVTWSPPSGESPTSYTVSSRPAGATVIVSGVTAALLSNLQNGTSYVFSVHATDPAGNGPESIVSNPVTPSVDVSGPGVATNIVASAGNGEATLTWTAPSNAGSAAITGYVVIAQPTLPPAMTTDATSLVIPDLINGNDYRFAVRALTASGEGPESVFSNLVVPCSTWGIVAAWFRALVPESVMALAWIAFLLFLCSAVFRRFYGSLSTALRSAIVVALIAGALSWAWHLRSLFDDSYISLRYARNLARGNGLVFNVGEHVEGYTNFLWTVVLAAGIRLGFDGPHLAFFGCLACFAAELLLVARVARLGNPDGEARFPLAALLLGASYAFASYGTTGMETMFAVLLVTLALERALVGWFGSAGLLAIFSVMAHPDYALLYAGLGAALLLDATTRRSLWRYALPFAVVYVPYFVWRWRYYGDFFPNTYYAKNGDLTYWRQGFIYVAVCGLGTGLATLAPLAGYALWRHPRDLVSRFALCGIAPYVLYVVRLGGDFMYARLLVPVLVVAALLAQRSIEDIVPRSRRVLAWSAAGLVGLAAVPVHLVKPREVRWFIADERSWYGVTNVWPELEFENPGLEERGLALREIEERGKVVVAEPSIGIIGWVSDAPLLDICGLTDRATAHLPTLARGRPGHEKYAETAYVRSRHVDLSREPLYDAGHKAQTLVRVGHVQFYLREYDPALIALLKSVPGASEPRIAFRIDDYIRRASASRPASLVDDIRFYEQFYFDVNPDPERHARLLSLLNQAS